MDGSFATRSWDGKGYPSRRKSFYRREDLRSGELGEIATAIYFPGEFVWMRIQRSSRADVQAELARQICSSQKLRHVGDRLHLQFVGQRRSRVAPSLILAGGGPDELDHCLRPLGLFLSSAFLIAQCDLRTFTNFRYVSSPPC